MVVADYPLSPCDSCFFQTPLLPGEVKGVSPKEAPPSKTFGKKDKDGKGGGKRGQESKGGKGSKSDPSGETPSGAVGCTAWPPFLALPCLVDVFSKGDMSQVACGLLLRVALGYGLVVSFSTIGFEHY